MVRITKRHFSLKKHLLIYAGFYKSYTYNVNYQFFKPKVVFCMRMATLAKFS